jgi:hypothetical protein
VAFRNVMASVQAVGQRGIRRHLRLAFLGDVSVTGRQRGGVSSGLAASCGRKSSCPDPQLVQPHAYFDGREGKGEYVGEGGKQQLSSGASRAQLTPI